MVNYTLPLFIVLLVVLSSPFSVFAHGELPEEGEEDKPLTIDLFLVILLVISITVGGFLFFIHNIQTETILIPIKTLAGVATATLLVNAMIVAYLYVEI
jgi:energy-coupling factor transporter transmembrane protein EcfT